MKTLHENWFAQGRIDFELKKYILLAYMQEINGQFSENKLYPYLADVIFHFNNLLTFKKNKDLLKNGFPKSLGKIDVSRLKILYDELVDDGELMEELERIINYSIAKMDSSIKDGKDIYDFVEDKLSIFPIGVLPLYPREGYLFISDGSHRSTKVYEFAITLYETETEKYRGIHTNYIESYQKNFIHTYEHIKCELIKNHIKLPNPAVYSVETTLSLPLNETLLPIAKRYLVKYISTVA